MKIIFESAEEKDDFIHKLVHHGIDCPRHLNLEDSKDCYFTDCEECWERALFYEIEE